MPESMEYKNITKRWSARRKKEVVLRLFRGEPIDEVSRCVGVATHRLHECKEEALKILKNVLNNG